MNLAPRVQLVTRRFWPLAGDVSWRWLALATALREARWQVEVVTALWHSSWPAAVELREFSVQRIFPSPTTPFRMRRAMRSLVEWSIAAYKRSIDERQPIDFLFVDAADDEASALLDNAKQLPPIVVRYETIETIGPLSERIRSRSLGNCQRANRVVVNNEHARRELVAHDVPPASIHLIHDAPLQRILRDASSVASARRALADINHELFLRGDDRLCVCLADFHKSSGVEFITRTLAPLLEQEHNVRLWLVGEGPERLRLYDTLRREGWRRDILMPGSFEDPDIVLAAADLCLVPTPSQGSNWVMPTALASGLTTFVCDAPCIRSRLGVHASELCFEMGDSQRLTQLFRSWKARSQHLETSVAEVAKHLWANNATIEQYRQLLRVQPTL